MLLLYEYDIFWAFLIISSVIPILAFLISGVLAPMRKGPEKLSSYESGIEPLGDAWLQFRICYYMLSFLLSDEYSRAKTIPMLLFAMHKLNQQLG